MKKHLLFMIVLPLFFPPLARAQEAVQASEYEVKAAFLFNFAKVVVGHRTGFYHIFPFIAYPP